MVTLRSTDTSDLDYVLKVEKAAYQLGYVAQWTREKHLSSLTNEKLDHMIIENDGPVGYLIGQRNADDNYELMRIVVSKRGYGYGKEAIKRLLNFAFNKLNTHRFWLDVRLHNDKAIKIYREIGFVEEGILREAVKLDSGYVSVMIMSILREAFLSDFGQEIHP